MFAAFIQHTQFMTDYVSRWKGDVTPPLPLIHDLDTDGIPPHLHELWYLWQVPVRCGICGVHYSARDAMIIGKECYGKFHRPQTLHIMNTHAIVPAAFVHKIDVTDDKLANSICVNTFDDANEWIVLRGARDTTVECPADVAQTFKIPQPSAPADVRASLTDMLGYITSLEQQESFEETFKPWEPLVFIPLF